MRPAPHPLEDVERALRAQDRALEDAFASGPAAPGQGPLRVPAAALAHLQALCRAEGPSLRPLATPAPCAGIRC